MRKAILSHFLHMHETMSVISVYAALSSGVSVCILPDREASLIKKEYCKCGPHPLQVTSSRARPPLVKGAGPHWPPLPGIPGLAKKNKNFKNFKKF